MILGFSLAIIAIAIASKTNRLPGKIAGTVTNPLLLNNKFCDNPTSVDQVSCTGFIPGVLAAVLTSPYQNVNGDVAISGGVIRSNYNNYGFLTSPKQFHMAENATWDPVNGWTAIQTGKGAIIQTYAQDGNYALFIQADNTSRAAGAARSFTVPFAVTMDGNVGIGTAGPNSPLHISGTGQADGAVGVGPALNVSGPTDTTRRVGIGYNESGDYGYIWSVDSQVAWKNLVLSQFGGNVGIGTANPVAKLDVAGEIHSSSTAAGFYLGAGCAKDNWLRLTKIAGACATADYHDLAVGQFWSNGALRFDLAEVTPSNAADNLEQGDVVIIDPTGNRITKSAKPYDATVYGIVSSYDQAAMVIGGDTSPESAKNVKDKTPVALAGRVKTKVSTENGPIEVGDYLTSSSTPGVTMKATRPGAVVGKALESYSSSGVGKIMAFVNVSWHDPDVYLASTDNFHLDFDQLRDAGNNLITRIGAFAKLIVGKIQAGIIETQKLIVNGVDISDKLNKQEQEIIELKTTVQQLQLQLQNR